MIKEKKSIKKKNNREPHKNRVIIDTFEMRDIVSLKGGILTTRPNP